MDTATRGQQQLLARRAKQHPGTIYNHKTISKTDVTIVFHLEHAFNMDLKFVRIDFAVLRATSNGQPNYKQMGIVRALLRSHQYLCLK